MLGQLARKEQPDGGLDFPRSDGGPLVRPAHLKGSSLTVVWISIEVMEDLLVI